MKNTGDRILRVGIEIGGSVGRSLDRSIRQARAQLGGLGTQMRDLGAQAERSFGRIADSRRWQVGAAAATGYFAVIGRGVVQARALNQELSGLSRHIDGLDASKLAAIQRQVLGISAQTGVRGTDIAALMVSGAESGRSERELGAFARFAARAGNATGMAPSETGQLINQFIAASGRDLAYAQTMFDSINAAADRTATNPTRLSDFLSRSLGLTRMSGLTSNDLTAIGAIQQDSGVSADVGATAFAAITRSLSAGSSATGSQRRGFEALGLDPTRVAKGLQTDGFGQLLEVFQRLKRLAPERQIAVLNDLFGAEAARGASPLISNLEKLVSLRQDLASGKAAGSIDREFERWAQSSAGQTARLTGNLEKFSTTLGATVAPGLNRLLELAVPVVERAAEWAVLNPDLTAGLVALGGALSALVIAAPALSAAFTMIAGAGKLLLGLKLGATIAGWAPALLALATGPIGLVTVAVLGVGAAVAWLYGRFEWFKAGVDGYLGGLVRGWSGAWTFITGLATGNMAKVRQGWGQMVSGMQQAFGSLLGLVRRGFAETFRWVLQQATALPGRLFGAFQQLGSMLTGGRLEAANNIRPIPRANGGPVRPRQAYLVGERRPEVVEFGASGRVYPSVGAYQQSQASGGPVTIAPVFHIHGSGDVEEQVMKAWRRLEWELQSGYRSLLND